MNARFCSICHEPMGPNGECGCGEPIEGGEEDVRNVLFAGAEAVKVGLLPIWTVYNRPRDYPEGFIARLHVAGQHGDKPTYNTLKGDLQAIRQIFWRAGLTRLQRHESDEPQIVEVWL